MLGSHVPAWEELRRALAELVAACGGKCAAVIDESNDIWCSSPAEYWVAEECERVFKVEVVARRGTPLRRGGKLSIVRPRELPFLSYAAESFAGIYVVVVWVEGELDPFLVRLRLRAALPRIEALTVALPPPDGPAGGEAAGKLRG